MHSVNVTHIQNNTHLFKKIFLQNDINIERHVWENTLSPNGKEIPELLHYIFTADVKMRTVEFF